MSLTFDEALRRKDSVTERLFIKAACQIKAQAIFMSVYTVAMFNKDLNAVSSSYLTC